MDKLEDTLYKIKRKISDEIYDALHELKYNYNCYLYESDIIDEALINALNQLDVGKIAKQALRKGKVIAIEQDKKYKIDVKHIKQVYKETNGIMPCLAGCGYTKQFTLNELLGGEGNYICRECSDKIEAEGNHTMIFEIFENNKNI